VKLLARACSLAPSFAEGSANQAIISASIVYSGEPPAD